MRVRRGPDDAVPSGVGSSDVEAGGFDFGEIVHSTGVTILARLLRREMRLSMVSALAGADHMEVAAEKAAGRSINRRYYLAGVAKKSGTPFWRALIELPGRKERLAFFRSQYERAREKLEQPFVKGDSRNADLEETLQIVLSGELIAHTPLADELGRFSTALCAHALAREVFWAAYLEESMMIPEVEEIFAQARVSQERVRDLESDLEELRQALGRQGAALLGSDPDAAVELRERLRGETEDLPPDALVYEPD